MFRGKTVPCYTTASPHGGITGENGPRPVLLLDGHNSRFNLAFLQYINDPSTKWFVAIGLPYGTHVWQIGDSSEQNGSFNNAFYEALDILFEEKLKTGQPATILKTDIIPLVIAAWLRSFGRQESNKTAILKRGWNPLNRGCLQDPEVLATKPAPKDATQEDSQPSTRLDVTGGGVGLSLLTRLNVIEGAAANTCAKLLEYSDTRAAQEAREENKNKGEKVADLAACTKNITLGMLFGMGHVLLGPSLLVQAQNKADNKQAETMYKTRPNDSPQQKLKTDLTIQWNNRKNRKSPQRTRASTEEVHEDVLLPSLQPWQEKGSAMIGEILPLLTGDDRVTVCPIQAGPAEEDRWTPNHMS